MASLWRRLEMAYSGSISNTLRKNRTLNISNYRYVGSRLIQLPSGSLNNLPEISIQIFTKSVYQRERRNLWSSTSISNPSQRKKRKKKLTMLTANKSRSLGSKVGWMRMRRRGSPIHIEKSVKKRRRRSSWVLRKNRKQARIGWSRRGQAGVWINFCITCSLPWCSAWQWG